jgi:Ca2+-binding RTX toxin-like protein
LEERTVPTAVPVPAGILSWWAGDGDASDLVGPNNGTLNNGVTFQQGESGDAFRIHASGDFVSAPTTNLPTGHADRTMELWVKFNSFPTSGESFIAGYGRFGTFNSTYQLGASGSQLFFSQWGGGLSGPSLQTGQWYHIAVTNVGNNITLYANGSAVASRSLTLNTASGTQFVIGRIPGGLGNARRLDGEVDEVSVYNRALSAAEIQSIYLAGANGKQKPYMIVDQSLPSEGDSVAHDPTDYTIEFDNPVDPASLHANGLTVNGLGADSVSLLNANTAQFHFNATPVSVVGTQTMAMAAGAVQASNGIAQPALRAWTKTFTAINAPPVVTIFGVPASGHSPEGTPIALADLVNDSGSADAGAGFTYAWSVTKNGNAYASGANQTITFTPDDDGTYVVTTTVTDHDGNVSRPAIATIVVDNVPPTPSLSGPIDGVRGQPRTYMFSATDPSPVDTAAGFTYTVNWGDGSPTQVISPTANNGSGILDNHEFAAEGTYNVVFTATDEDGGKSLASTLTVHISKVAVQADPLYPGQTMLVAGGTPGDDKIFFRKDRGSGAISVQINNESLGSYSSVGRIVAYSQAGNDLIRVASDITVPAWLHAGDGNDTLIGGSGHDVLIGGAGNDVLVAGTGHNLLIGGAGADYLFGQKGENIAITGTTDYDSNDVALAAIMAEWTSKHSYAERVANLSGTGTADRLNGNYFLIAGGPGATVHGDGKVNRVFGGSGGNWYFAQLSGVVRDLLEGKRHGEVVEDIGS